MSEMIDLKHPQNKKGARIRMDKYELMKEEILHTIGKHKEIAYKDLTKEINESFQGRFEGGITWYVTAVKLDLEARGMIERFTQDKVQHLRLACESQTST